MSAASRFSVAFAISIVVGALIGGSGHGDVIPALVIVALVGVGAATRRRWVLVVVGLAMSISFAADARSGVRPVHVDRFDGVAVIASDPADRFGAVMVDVRTDLGRFEVVAYGAVGRQLRGAVVGERVDLAGRISQLSRPERSIARHVRGRITAERAFARHDPEQWSIPVATIRSAIANGASVLPMWERPIYLGFLLGDDRGESTATATEFERAGLSHLLVVSGENVGFVIIVASPLLDRLGSRRRRIALLALLVMFAAVTRFEPSVLRAVAMAGVVSFGGTFRRRSGIVALADAVALVVLIDPLIVWSVGFRLSVAATIGIILIAPRLAASIPGPRWIATGTAVTIGAQMGAAPLLIPLFGPIRLVSVPANVLAEPAAGFVMMWGCTGGVVAGAIGGPIGALLQLPCRLGIWWIASVAHIAALMPSPTIDLVRLAIVIASLLVARAARRAVRRRRVGNLAV